MIRRIEQTSIIGSQANLLTRTCGTVLAGSFVNRWQNAQLQN